MNLTPSEQLQYSTIRLISTLAGGKHASGTAFVFRLSEKDNQHIPVIVTNKHVIDKSLIGTFSVHLADEGGNPIAGKGHEISIPDFERYWIKHPDPLVDLAVMPIAPLIRYLEAQGKKPYFCSLGSDIFPTQEDIDGFGAVEDILMVGYPIGLWDAENNLPIFRRGVTATHPARNYNGKKEFLIDCACFPGSSGSPVLLYNHGTRYSRSGSLQMGSFIKFLGVLYAGPQYTAEGAIVITNIPTAQVPIAQSKIPANLGFIIKAELLKDFEALFKKNEANK